MKFVAPTPHQKSFTCPHCGVLARQNKWGYSLQQPNGGAWQENQLENAELRISKCDNCSLSCVWVGEIFVYPKSNTAPLPNLDMPEGALSDYREAARICADSPRGAAALLRLAVQKLMKHLDQPGKNINDDIAALVASGLPRPIQQALDVVRVTGNNAVHPGQLDANDVEVVQQLFPLVNLIVEYQISMPAKVEALYMALPPGAREGIAKRDGAQ